MDDFQLSSDMDMDRVFLVKHSELEGRFDPQFYRPCFVKIDKAIKAQTETRLGDLIVGMYGGATPKKSEAEKYYSDKENGIPLLRVQNITEEGINLDDAVYINYETHTGYLNRSQVLQDDVLVTITGRIASSAVAPSGFTANTNQHSVVIKTTDPNISKYIATFLNSNVGQQLALKRTTGGTRPALDYDALKSIPIPEKLLIVEVMDTAYAAKKQKEAEAQRLLDSIDDSLLGELGVKFPDQNENTIQNRMFERPFSEVIGKRFDAPFHQQKYNLKSDKFPTDELRNCVFINPTTSFIGLPLDTLATFIPMEKISDLYGEADISNCRTLAESEGYTRFRDNDLLWAKITPCMQNGKSAVVSGLKNGIGFGSTEYHVFRAKPGIDIRYIHSLLRLRSLRDHAVLYFSGSAGQQRVSDKFFKILSIPKPPLKKQTEIANHIDEIRNQARQLQQQAKSELEQAKKEVEMMILGEDKCNA